MAQLVGHHPTQRKIARSPPGGAAHVPGLQVQVPVRVHTEGS